MAGWLEPRTRIPFLGIVAMVVIVAVVAGFLKVQMNDIFPASTITIQSDDEAGDLLTGKVTSSFEGLREIRLSRESYLQGVLHRSAALTFTLSPGLLTVRQGDTTEEVIMEGSTVTFEFLGVTRKVMRNGDTLIYSEPGKSVAPTTIILSERSQYVGEFMYHGDRAFRYDPAASVAWVDGDAIPLTDGKGVWVEGGDAHPVRIEGGLAIIEELW